MVDEWREDKQNREETVKALKMIREDLVADTVSLGYTLRYIDHFYNMYTHTAKNDNHIKTPDSLHLLLNYTRYLYLTDIKKTGISSFENVSNKIIRNDSVLKYIAEYYSDGMLNTTRDALVESIGDGENPDKKQIGGNDIGLLITRLKKEKDVSEFSIDNYKEVLIDSSPHVLKKYEKYIENLEVYINSGDFLERLNSKRAREGHYGLHVRKKLRISKKLIGIIDQELKKKLQ